MLLLFTFLAFSLRVQINGNAPVEVKLIEDAVSLSGFPDSEINSIHVLSGELNPRVVATHYKNLKVLIMDDGSSILENKIPANCFARSNLKFVSLRGITRIDHDAFDQSADDAGSAVDPPGVSDPDLVCYEAFPEIFPGTAGIPRKCKRSGGRDIQRT